MPEDSITLRLADKLGSGLAAELKELLQGNLGRPVTLDAANVSHLGAQSLQVLLSAKRYWEKSGIHFEIAPVSDQFAEALELFGTGSLISQSQEATDEA